MKALRPATKWAILELFHTIELLLKERLRREHSLLIHSNINKRVTADSKTATWEEALGRFINLGIDMPQEHLAILRDLRRRRNTIEHHRFSPEDSHRQVLGEALKFIRYFLEEHLSADLFASVREIVYEYEQLPRRAEASMTAARSRFRPKEQLLIETGECPECGNETVLVGATEEPYCHFCQATVRVAHFSDLRQCMHRAVPTTPRSLRDLGTPPSVAAPASLAVGAPA